MRHRTAGAQAMARTRLGFAPACTVLPTRRGAAISRTAFTGVRVHAKAARTRAVIATARGHGAAPAMTAGTRRGPALVEGLITLFPAWAVGASVLAYQSPQLFVGIGPTAVRLALAGVMLSTGLTLTRGELRAAAARPAALAAGLLGCFALMPAAAWALARAFALDGPQKAGLLLLGVVSGGQMSNLCTSIARGDTALSVAMTTASTLAAAFALPALAKLLLQATVPVDAAALAVSTASFVLAPVLLGAALSGVARPIRHALPLVGIVLVLVLIVGPVAQTAAVIGPAFRALALPVTLLHVCGGLAGYAVSRVAGKSEAFARAMAFETGFKSPALSFVLAQAHFADPGVALASAVSIVTLAPLGALFAVLLRFFPPKEKAAATPAGTPPAVRARRLGANGGKKVVMTAHPRPADAVDTKKLRLKDEEKLKVDEFEVSWDTTPCAESDGVVAPDERTRYQIFVPNRKPMSVHYGALAAKLRLLRQRGHAIAEVRRVDGLQ